MLLAVTFGTEATATPVCCRDFATSQGELIDSFENMENWTISGTATADNKNYKEGSQGIKLVATSASNPYIIKTTNISMATAADVSVWAYVENVETLDSIVIYLGDNSAFSKYYFTSVGPSYLRNGWNHLTILKDKFTTTTGMAWQDPIRSIKIKVNSNLLGNAAVTFDNLRYKRSGKATIIIGFDDGLINVSLKAYPIMAANNQRGVIFVSTAWINTVGKLSLSDLNTMYEDGWDISSHSVNDKNLLSTPDTATITAELQDSQAWLLAHGFKRSAYVYAYPGGAYNQNIIDEVKKYYVLARSVDPNAYSYYQPDSMHGDLNYRLSTQTVTKTTSPQYIMDKINTTIDASGLLILSFHDIGDDGDASNSDIIYNVGNFKKISDYIASRNADIDVITFSDLLIFSQSSVPELENKIDIKGYLLLIYHKIQNMFTQFIWMIGLS